MLLTIHDSALKKVGFIDNNKEGALNYFNDEWHRYLETGSSTFDFTVFKKAIISDSGTKKAYNYLNEKAFVSFQYKGKTYLHTIRKVEENEKTIKCYGINLNLELVNEYANPYKSSGAMSFQEYCNELGLVNFTLLKIGINEVSDQKIVAEWEGTDTKLNRLLSLANKFSAEIEFDTQLNADSSIKSFIINVYHQNDDNHHGVGRTSSTILQYGKNLKALTRTVDKSSIYNMVRPTGKTENGDVVTISSLGAWSVDNDKGEREFYQQGEALYAPFSMQMYPSAFTSTATGDQWIRKDMEVESSNPEVIRSTAYRELKKNCYPAVTYEVDGFADLDIGDTVQVIDDGFSPALLLEMRVSEQTISFSKSSSNKTTFSNAKALENRLSGGIQKRLEQLIEDAKPYSISLSTDNGTIFKNLEGISVVSPTLLKGNKAIDTATWRWTFDNVVTAGATFKVVGAKVTATSQLLAEAYVGNTKVAEAQLSFVGVSDGVVDKEQLKLINDKIEAKADKQQVEEFKSSVENKEQLTQEQLNALSEKNSIVEAELGAKASLDTVNQWFKAYQDFVNSSEENRAKSEKDLISATQRVLKLETNLGDMAQRWNFIDTYMQATNEGLSIGKKDGSSFVRMGDNRISFYSAGKEVAYFSGGALQVDNGVFTKTLQIGRFREEQYLLNADMNVIRYIGGV